MKLKDIPWSTPTGPIPLPCFSDTNITVYAIPTLPSLSGPLSFAPSSNISSVSTTSTEPSSMHRASTSSPELSPEKRKREPSPAFPRKRLNSGSLAPGRMILSEDLLSEVAKKDFDPLTLSGPIVDEYRDMIVKAMFPNTRPNGNLDPATKQDRRRRSKQGMRAKASGLISLFHSKYDSWTSSIRYNAASSGG